MKTIILGAGEVGFNLAKNLSSDGHDIVIIDNDPDKVRKINETLDVLSIQGEATGLENLKKAGLENADMLVAVTSTDEVNIVACMLAQKLGVKTKIARIRKTEYFSPEFILPPGEMGIDLMIHPEQEAANEIVKLIKYPRAFDMVEFAEGKIVLLGLLIDPSSPVVGQSLSEIVPRYEELQFRAVAVLRKGQTIIPKGTDVVMPGDRYYVVVKRESLQEVLNFSSSEPLELQNIMILGGGKIGRMVAKELSEFKRLNVKVVETDREKSRLIAEQLTKVLVVHGDGTDIDLLAQEGISEMDAFLALTNNDETNIVSSLLARHLKVKRTITLVSRGDYLPIIKTIGLDVAVNMQILTSDAILRFIRGGLLISLKSLRGVDAETVEIETPAGCRIAGKKLREIRFPPGVIVGAMVHNGEVSVPVGDSLILPGDRVVLFTIPQSLEKLEKLFSS